MFLKKHKYLQNHFSVNLIIFFFIICFSSAFTQNTNKSFENELTYEGIRPKIALVLSGGGARGTAQIGVLKELEAAGIKIDYIVGTSMGAIIGGLYSSGYTASELDSIVVNADWGSIFSLSGENERRDYFLDQKIISDRTLLTLRFNNFKFIVPEAITFGNRLSVFLQKLVWNAIYHSDSDFDRLKYKFRAITTDISTGKTVSLKSGSLVMALRASSVIPLRITPVRIDSMVLVDGGLLANIPTEQTTEFNPDIIIAVNTTSPMLQRDQLDKPWNLADQVVTLVMKNNTTLKPPKCDVMIKPTLDEFSNTDFSGIKTIIERGQSAAADAIEKIQSIIDKKRDSIVQNKLHINDSGSLSITCEKNELNINADKIKTKEELSRFISLFLSNEKNVISSVGYNINKTDSVSRLTMQSIKYPLISDISVFSDNLPISGRITKIVRAEFKDTYLNPYSKSKIVEKILRIYNTEGFSFASLRNFNFDENTGMLNVFIDEVKINTIKIKGSKFTSDYLIKREIGFREGEPANANKILNGWENLVTSGLFYDSDISLNSEIGEKGIEIIINVKERPPQVLSVSGRIDNERYAQGNLDLIQENIFNSGGSFNINFSGGLRNFRSVLGLNFSRIWSTFATFNISSYYNRTDIFSYTPITTLPRNRFEDLRTGEYGEERFGFNTSLGSQIEKKGVISVALRYERQRSKDYKTGALTPISNIQTVKVGTTFDTQDRSEFASYGSFLSLYLETSLLQSPNFTGFSKAEFIFHTNYQLNPITIRPSFHFGFADQSLPDLERFSLGGQESFFGLSNDEYRGRQIAVSSIELSYKLPFRIIFDSYVNFRYDLGSVWQNVETIKFESLKHGTGLELAIDTPVGPAQFSLGRAFYFLKSPNTVVLGPVSMYYSIGVKF